MKTPQDLLLAELAELQETWSYTTEELSDIADKIIKFASYAIMDSEVQKFILDYKE
jgi:hypothetical protein